MKEAYFDVKMRLDASPKRAVREIQSSERKCSVMHFFCDNAIEMQAIWVQATACLLDLTSPLTAEPVDSFFTVCIHGRYRKDDGELAERTG